MAVKEPPRDSAALRVSLVRFWSPKTDLGQVLNLADLAEAGRRRQSELHLGQISKIQHLTPASITAFVSLALGDDPFQGGLRCPVRTQDSGEGELMRRGVREVRQEDSRNGWLGQ